MYQGVLRSCSCAHVPRGAQKLLLCTCTKGCSEDVPMHMYQGVPRSCSYAHVPMGAQKLFLCTCTNGCSEVVHVHMYQGVLRHCSYAHVPRGAQKQLHKYVGCITSETAGYIPKKVKTAFNWIGCIYIYILCKSHVCVRFRLRKWFSETVPT